MSETETIRVDGSSEPERGPAVRSLVVVIGLIGLGLGVVLWAMFSATSPPGPVADPPPGGQRIASPVPIPTTTTTAASVAEPTLVDLAPMLDTGLIGIGTDTSGSGTAELWRMTADAPTALDLPAGGASTDISGRWLALLTQSRYSDHLSLWVGNPAYAEPLSASVLGAVWSTDEAAAIAWAEPRASSDAGGAQTALFTQRLTGSSLAVRTETLIPGRVVPIWFTSAGVVVTDGAGALSLVPPLGDVVSTLQVERLHAATDRYALVDVDGRSALVSPFLQFIDEFPVDVSGCAIGRFAPPDTAAARRIALECQQQPEGQIFLHVWEISESSSGLETTQIASLPQLNLSLFSWTSEDVLVAPFPVNTGKPETLLTIWDVDDGASERIRWPGLIYQIVPFEP